MAIQTKRAGNIMLYKSNLDRGEEEQADRNDQEEPLQGD